MFGYQAPKAVMLVRPLHFGYNPETAASNAFQKAEGNESLQEIRTQAMKEFDGLVTILKSTGVNVIECHPDPDVETPDEVFPNNWVSFHHDGKVIVYPMMAPSRRLERRLEFITSMEKQHQFQIREIMDLSHFENQGHFLEGTGSMVMDYVNGIIYANHSPRTSMMLLNKVAELLGFEVCSFNAKDNSGQDIYHTNVMMCVGNTFAIVCMDSVDDPASRAALEKSLVGNGHDIIDITRQQMSRFAGNMMEMTNDKGESVLVMSQNAFTSLNQDQIRQLKRHSTLIYAAVDTIEKYGGGSVRCMLAGIFLPRK